MEQEFADEALVHQLREYMMKCRCEFTHRSGQCDDCYGAEQHVSEYDAFWGE